MCAVGLCNFYLINLLKTKVLVYLLTKKKTLNGLLLHATQNILLMEKELLFMFVTRKLNILTIVLNV